MRDKEVVEHWRGRDESTEDEDEAMLPVAAEETLVGEDEHRKEDDKDEWGDAEGNVGVKPEPEEEASPEEIREFSCT